MEILNRCKSLFPLEEEVSMEEKISEFRLICQLTNAPILILENFQSFMNQIPDPFKIYITVEENDSLIFTKGSSPQAFIEELDSHLKYFEPDEEKIKFEIIIDKNKTPNLCHIYSFLAFDSFIKEIHAYDLLKIFKDIVNPQEKFLFKFLEKSLEPFYSAKFTFGYEINDGKQPIDPFTINENCHFSNFQSFPFSPDYFHLQKRTEKKTSIEEKLDILTTLFSIVSIFDITTIKSTALHYKLTGYRTYEGEIPLTQFRSSYSSYEPFYFIFDWIYSSKGNLADKIGIARNIISIYIDGKSLAVDASILLSIKSSYNLYLKENINRYLEIRNKLFDDLSWISQKSGEIVEKFLTDYQKSIFTFLSFFISIFVIRIISAKEYTNIFSRDATILSFAFLGLSLIYLGFSRWNLQMEKKRLTRKYGNLKIRYKDLIEENDIEEILNKDSEFEYEKDFINQRVSVYTILWLLTILILMCAIISISSYVTWEEVFRNR